MEEKIETKLAFTGSFGTLPIHPDDVVAKKLAMLFESRCMGLGPDKAAKKFGCCRARYFQIQKAYLEGGTEALNPKRKGPKNNYVRTETIVNQIIRHRFLDPDASVAVITQKMNQNGYNISKRSVERTITEFGLQKKTPFVKSGKRDKNGCDSSDKT